MAPLSIPAERLEQLRADYLRECAELWQRSAGAEALPVLTDRRFASPAWSSQPTYAFTAAWYLLNSRYAMALADALEVDQKTRERVRFFVEQWLAAVAPSNFLAFNPDAQRALIDSRGESLRHGIENLLGDLARGKLSQTDGSRFVIGENIATTSGTVVFENDLAQLIQYTPRTATVFERPLLIVPPCINKFYILDLRPDSSLVQHALDAGHQVFIVSWRNPDATLAHKGWDDYVDEGILQTIDAVLDICGTEQLNALGFCVGGTMLATALAVCAARGRQPAASLTLLTAMLDFSDTGVLDVFIDEAHVEMREHTIGGKGGATPGLMRGAEFASTFSFLRPNELVWNYVVDNYLKGATPPPFDLLFWNADSTNLPGPMVAWYVRNTYLENRLREPGALTVCGAPVDLGSIAAPLFVYGSRDDHIVPWRTAYASTGLVSGPAQFVLGASGHIAGVINPPARNKRSYWRLDAGTDLPASADAWLAAATEQPGSWWPSWTDWLAGFGGRRRKPRGAPGSARHVAIEAAPGRYVRENA